MDHLSDAQRAELRALLLAARDALDARAGAQAEEAAPDDYLGDIQDDAAEEARRRRALGGRERDDARLAEIQAALRRMDDGTYGICEETGEEIPFGRLRAEPTTRFTVEALELLEEEQARERTSDRADEPKAY